MAGETSNIAKMAVFVSDELLTWFRWNRVELPDQNFDCVKVENHTKKKANHTHPVDAVFWYKDPYLNRVIYLNTDLKSYAKGSIDAKRVYDALKSLAYTIDCARVSEEWQDRYHNLGDMPYEVRGMLFVYNHDTNFDGSFYEMLSAPTKRRKGAVEQPLKLENLPLEDGQIIHVFEPELISYLTTVVADTQRLHTEGTFPERQYEFFYPELRLHKTSGARLERPATAEMLTGPFLIIHHEAIKKFNEASEAIETTFSEGYVIYYKRPGESAEEFVYLLDILSGYQILDGQHKIRIRLTHQSVNNDSRSNFKRAINLYAHEWGFDTHKLTRLQSIELEVIEVQKYSFSRVVIGWEK